MIYPWQTEQWQQLARAKQNQRLPHALLLSGNAGMGKRTFAQHFIHAFFCLHAREMASLPVQGGDAACACHPCRLIQNRVHPNIFWVEPEKPGSAIKIDQVRELSEFVQQTSLQGQYRFVVMSTAHAMNANAANALLKTLEEPASGAILILMTDQFAQLPATVLSRCQRMTFARPPKEMALAWLMPQLNALPVDAETVLRLAQGAPLAALQWAQGDILTVRQQLFQALLALKSASANPLAYAAEFQTIDVLTLLDFMLTWVMDLLRLQVGCAIDTLLNQDYHAELTALLPRMNLDACQRYHAFLQQLRAQVSLGMNLNKPLLIESALIRWLECA